MKKLILTLFLFIPINLFAQSEKVNEEPIVFEQVALNYFISNILNKESSFENLKVYFNGKVDSIISPLAFTCIEDKMYKVPGNEDITKLVDFETNAPGSYWRARKKAPFPLKVDRPIKEYSPKIFAPKHRTRTMTVYQNKNVGDRNFVWIKLYKKKKWGGESIYIIMDNNGLVKDWCFSTFVH